MAIINAYVNPNIAANGYVNNTLSSFRGGGGCSLQSIYETFVIGATDNAASVYRIFKSLNANITPIRIAFANTAMAGSTSFHLGLYRADFGAIVGTGNQFVNAGTLATARASLWPATALDGMSAVNINAYGQRLLDYAGETMTAPTIATTRVEAFDLCLTLNTSGLVTGTVSVLMDFVNN